MLLETLKSEAIERGLLKPEEEIGLEQAFVLVRDMPYIRASSRDPGAIIQEWRGTCSGKHYLLKRLFAELGYQSKLIACTTVARIDPKKVRGKLRKLLEQSNGRFVDVHNYLILELPEGI
jgi:arylamine N-acetyltransferase